MCYPVCVMVHILLQVFTKGFYNKLVHIEAFPLIIQWVVEQTSQNAYLLHYMDDFLVGG